MKKYIVLSVNDNVDYLFFAPLVCWAWRKFGWDPIVFYHGNNKSELYDLVNGHSMPGQWEQLEHIEGYRPDTITQISRLYGSCLALHPDNYIMTGDIDMLPLSDYWRPKEYQVTVWGHDLTGYGHYPICYIGASVSQWRDIMKAPYEYSQCIKRDLDTLPQAKDPDFYKYWFSDQDLVTQRLNEYGKEKITFINRGQYPNGFAKGRVDRGDWHLNHDQFIDAHLMQQVHHKEEKIDTLMQLLRYNWPDEDFTWFEKYTEEFKKLAV